MGYPGGGPGNGAASREVPQQHSHFAGTGPAQSNHFATNPQYSTGQAQRGPTQFPEFGSSISGGGVGDGRANFHGGHALRPNGPRRPLGELQPVPVHFEGDMAGGYCCVAAFSGRRRPERMWLGDVIDV